MIRIHYKFIFLFSSILLIISPLPQVQAANDIETLIEKLGDNDVYAAENAANQLVSKGSFAVDKLLSRIDDHDRNIASRCIEILGKIGDKKAADPLINKLTHLADKNEYETFTTRFLRISTIKALGDLKDPKAIEILKNVKDNGTEYDKIHSLSALAKIGDETIIPEFIIQLGSSNKNIRCIAVESLGDFGIKESTNALIESLKDTEWFVRDAACESLGKLNAVEAIPYIQALQKDPVPFVRETAKDVIKKLTLKVPATKSH